MQNDVILPNDHFFRKEKKVLEEFKKVEQINIIDDASNLFINYDECYDRLLKKQKKTNVLITGITGVGKSSLINSIFGKIVAKTGTGRPVTQHFVKYSSDNFPVNIYDSKGLEHGNAKEFIKSTKNFLEKHKVGKNGEINKAIHVVWYIVNSASGRWQPFEENLCKKLFKDIPIIFILNKADLTTDYQRSILKKCIEKMDLNNTVGIFNVISNENIIKKIKTCSNCGSDDICIRKKILTSTCFDCKFKESLEINNGRPELVMATYKILPSFVKNAFTMTQKVSLILKKQHSLVIIKDFWKEWSHVYTVNKFLKIIIHMMLTLSLNWNFKHSEDYAKFVAKDLVKVFTLNDKIKLLFHSNTYKQKLHCTSLGILWNRFLWNLNKCLLSEWNKLQNPDNGHILCKNKVNYILSDFNCTNLAEIEFNLNKYGIDTFLLKEFT